MCKNNNLWFYRELCTGLFFGLAQSLLPEICHHCEKSQIVIFMLWLDNNVLISEVLVVTT